MGETELRPRACLSLVEHRVYVLFNEYLTLRNGCCLAFSWKAGEHESEEHRGELEVQETDPVLSLPSL